jgi:hypothetical protein
MNKKYFDVRTYYSAPECECGGTIYIPISGIAFTTKPIKRIFKCNKCGKEVTLSEPDFPGLRHDILGIEVKEEKEKT